MDHFGLGIELLDIHTDDENRLVNFTCFTEKTQKRGANINEGKPSWSGIWIIARLLTGSI